MIVADWFSLETEAASWELHEEASGSRPFCLCSPAEMSLLSPGLRSSGSRQLEGEASGLRNLRKSPSSFRSIVEFRGLPEGLPLQSIVAKHDKRDAVARDDLKEFLCACAKRIFIVVVRPCSSVGGKQALHHDGVNGQEH